MFQVVNLARALRELKEAGVWLAGASQEADTDIFHADLNANNILLNEHNEIILIDFDRGEFRQDGNWKQANLERLLRSLNKLQNIHTNFYFTKDNWQTLLQAYQEKTS